MTQQEFLAAVQEYRGAWVRQAKGLLEDHYEAAEDIVQATIAELSGFDVERAVYRYEPIGISEVTRRVEYRVQDYLVRDAEGAQPVTEDGDDTESIRFKRGKVTVAWVMECTEAYQQQVDIRRAMAALPHRQRYVAAMVLVEGLTTLEVALKLGISQSRVVQILEQVKKALRKSLAAYGGE